MPENSNFSIKINYKKLDENAWYRNYFPRSARDEIKKMVQGK
jgi:hypothetical protein